MGEAKNIYFTCLKLKRKLFVCVDKLRNLLGLRKKLSLKMGDAETMRAQVAELLRGIDRYNPEHLTTLEAYVNAQAQEVTYDLEANLTVLKLYQFNPGYYNQFSVGQILFKALTNLPHTDLVMCKCLIEPGRLDGEENPLRRILNITYQNIEKEELRELLGGVDTPALHQWISRYGWRDNGDGSLFIQNQDTNVKTKEIVEKISFENVAPVLASLK